jgi:hypothetical protein
MAPQFGFWHLRGRRPSTEVACVQSTPATIRQKRMIGRMLAPSGAMMSLASAKVQKRTISDDRLQNS